MECVNLEYSRRRPLPLELLVEMHKCLPLADANKSRMLRTIRQLKKSQRYIDTLVSEKGREREGEKLVSNEIEWKPELDTFLRYGSCLTSIRKFYCPYAIYEVPENFVEKLLLHLANSSSTQMMLQIVDINFSWSAQIPKQIFLKPLFNEKYFPVGNRILFESVELKAEDGRTIYIHDGELLKYRNGEYKLKVFVQNKIDRKWFKITMNLDYSKEYIFRLKFEQWKMQSLVDVNKFVQKFGNLFEEKDGNTLVSKKLISSNSNLDLFLRRGAKFTQFRHLKINQEDCCLFCCPDDYIDFLINFVSNAKYPEEFLESIDLKFDLPEECPSSSSIKKLWEKCIPKEIPKGGKFVKFDKKLYILSAKRKWFKLEDSSDDSSGYEEIKLEFRLANLPTNGEYLFDVCVEFENGLKEIIGIKIEKRKNDQIIEFNCNDQMEKQPGMKRKASNDDGEEDKDGQRCSSKMMKK